MYFFTHYWSFFLAGLFISWHIQCAIRIAIRRHREAKERDRLVQILRDREYYRAESQGLYELNGPENNDPPNVYRF